MRPVATFFIVILILVSTINIIAAAESWYIDEVELKALEIEEKVIGWRRKIHQIEDCSSHPGTCIQTHGASPDSHAEG